VNRRGPWFVLFAGAIAFVFFRDVITDNIGPYEKTGVVTATDSYTVEEFDNLNINRSIDLVEIVFEDGSWATGTDQALSTVRIGSEVTLRCHRDRDRIPIFDPGWWACEDAELLR